MFVRCLINHFIGEQEVGEEIPGGNRSLSCSVSDCLSAVVRGVLA